MTYRPDIDGLRALAVLAVVLFHLELDWLAGGFVGVDIFFVISGYLITSIILRGLEEERFTFGGFYARRIRRLLPALVATVAATSIAAALLMTPNDLIGFARSAVAALFSVSNFVFFAEAGYWDTTSELKPLLHTWSLGIEEQYYLFWPALLVLFWKWRRARGLGPVLLGFTVLGYLLCAGFTRVNEPAAFYLLPFRAFQFAMGAWILTLVRAGRGPASPFSRQSTSLAGLILIAASVLVIDGGMRFPGWIVLAPTLGAALILLSGAQPSGAGPVARVLLENPLALWLGRVSYSMYLVHWPLVSLYRYRTGLELSGIEQAGLAVSTLLLTVLLHHGVERRFYQRSGPTTESRSDNGRFALRTIGVATAVAVVVSSAWLGGGWAWRFDDLKLTPAQIERGTAARELHVNRGCSLHREHRPDQCDMDAPHQVLVFGDSHEPDAFNFLVAELDSVPGVNLISFGMTNDCTDLVFEAGRASSRSERCQERLDRIADPAFVSQLDVIVYSARRPFAANKKPMLAILRGLFALNPDLKLVTFGPYIYTHVDCARLINESGNDNACAVPENVSYFGADPSREGLFDEIMALTDAYVDRVALLCQDRKLPDCITRSPEGVPLMYDSHHQSLEFAEMSGRMHRERHPNFWRDLLEAP